jgi:hypothetical protein
MNTLPNVLTILSSMITPVVLIMASGSLILTTSQRLGRVIERTRKLTDRLKEFGKSEKSAMEVEEEGKMLFNQLKKATTRARLLQRAMTSLYCSLSFFVATSIAIGVVDITHLSTTWIPFACGIIGAVLLFFASIVLMKESAIALAAVNQEMNYAIYLFERNFPDMPKRKTSWWQQLLSLKTQKENLDANTDNQYKQNSDVSI